MFLIIKAKYNVVEPYYMDEYISNQFPFILLAIANVTFVHWLA
jgi:hypothetical protein